MADLGGGHLVARTLKQAGVGHIFTLCGGHILPIYDGCLTRGRRRWWTCATSRRAAHAADAYARLTREYRRGGGDGGAGRHRRGHRRRQCLLRARARCS